ncbi:AppA family phytase/histidine-type acid phosphatase [Edwardsiella piscicida]|uniref:AppA family phytase/histidine-type acid phosphatase n=1 Tax=Edwardsiella piscicida TaxID=1263550 RepID=UPI00290E6F11|nr:AppA family phytase/histidine-type acid phosphatase [Edwardsiella piscicida]
MRWRDLSRWLSPLSLTLLFPLPLPLTASAAEPAVRHLERVVIVSRHGVRAPTKMPALIREVTPDTWPVWPVPLGDITPRGESLVTLLGAYYRQQLSREGLLPAQGCPPAGWVYAWTDVDQRTRKTGEAFLQGLAPRCAIAIHHRPDVSQRDPLFHPVKAGSCRLDKAQARRAIEAQAGMPLADLNRRYGAALAQMDETLRFASSPYCQRHSGEGACTLAQAMPTRLHIDAHGALALRGAVGLSATLAEMFLLQQAQGMAQPAWGRITTPAQWRALLHLHNLQFDLLSRTDYIARHRGTPLMYTVLQALNGQTPSLPGLTAQNRLLLLVGHDTNLANLSGMLQTPWSLPEQPDNTPPGGELRFERWRDSADRVWVRVSVVYQSLAQQRQQTRLTLQAPPHQVILALPGCRGETADGFCPLDAFSQWLSSRLIPACLPASDGVASALP